MLLFRIPKKLQNGKTVTYKSPVCKLNLVDRRKNNCIEDQQNQEDESSRD